MYLFTQMTFVTYLSFKCKVIPSCKWKLVSRKGAMFEHVFAS